MPLRGLRVVELAGLAPAPFCGMILADFGASVIRVDKRAGFAEGLDCLGNGKKSIVINLKSPKGIDVLRRLCRETDILIEPFRKGVMEKLGLSPSILLAENPKLIYARLTGFGQSGKYSSMAGHDINYLSISGLLSLFGRTNEKPIAPVNLAADFGGGGLTCAFGIILALLERAKSGKGQVVDSSMVEGAAYLGSWLYRSQHLPMWGKPRGDNLLDTGSHFYDTYETKDGKFMAVGALEPQFYAILLEGLGLSESDVPQFGDSTAAKKIFREKFREKTQEEWYEIFDMTDACVTPVLSMREASENPHNVERNAFTVFADVPGFKVPNPAPLLSRTPGRSKASLQGPQLGEHTEEILKSLNYKNEEIKQLIEEEVVSCGELIKAKL